MTSYYQSSDGLRLSYTIKGNKDGLPVLCLPGVTRNSSDFNYLAQNIREYALICPNYRGRGQSEWDSNPDNYNALVEARDILILMDLLEISSAPIIGTSRGGMIAIVMANLDASRIAGIMFNDIGPVIDKSGLIRILEYIGRNPSAKTIPEAAENLQKFNVGFEDVPQERWLEEAQKHYLTTTGGLKINYDPKLRIGFKQYLNTGKLELWEEFGILKSLPFGVIRGVNSDILSLETIQRMEELFPHGAYAEVPDRGHVPFLDERECLDVINTFLKQTTSQ